VKVQDNGTIDVNVADGSKFEIVTPSAIVGVRGTKFSVATNSNGSTVGYQAVVTLTEGTVTVMDRETGETALLTGTGSTTTGSAPMHSHYHTHANGERHMPDHPSQNNAHHGKLLAETGDNGSIADPGDITICHKPGTPAEKNMVIDPSSLSIHLGHGDYKGACQ
jgi:hypothetical protein